MNMNIENVYKQKHSENFVLYKYLKPTYFKQKYYIILVEGFERLIIKFTEFHAICKID